MKEISVIMPAYMVAGNIRHAVQNTIAAMADAGIERYEIMIGASPRRDGKPDDGTLAIADELAAEYPCVRVLEKKYSNLGDKFWMGVDHARFANIVMVASDNEIAKEAISAVLTHVGEADIITSYAANMSVRPFMRRVVSRTFTFLMNAITGLRLRYYNGMCVHRVELLRQLPSRNDSFAYMAEILATLVQRGHSYREVPIMLQPRPEGSSVAFRRDNVIQVCATLGRLFWNLRVRGQARRRA